MQIRSAAAATKVIRVINSCRHTEHLDTTAKWAINLDTRDYFKTEDIKEINEALKAKHTQLTGESAWLR